MNRVLGSWSAPPQRSMPHRLAHPDEAYAQLGEESPGHAAQMAPERRESLAGDDPVERVGQPVGRQGGKAVALGRGLP